MTLLRKLLILVVLVLLVCIAAVFAWNNPDPISVDIGIARFENTSLALVLACAFAVGWLFGLASVGWALLRMAAEKRHMRRELRNAETEVASLRTLPMNDAN